VFVQARWRQFYEQDRTWNQHFYPEVSAALRDARYEFFLNWVDFSADPPGPLPRVAIAIDGCVDDNGGVATPGGPHFSLRGCSTAVTGVDRAHAVPPLDEVVVIAQHWCVGMGRLGQ
jgi:hypothetical protein